MHDSEQKTSESEAPEASRPSPEVIGALLENQRAFLAFIERRVGSRAEAEDILQEAFARSLDRLSELRDDERVVAWFYRMLRNAVVDRARGHGVRQKALAKFADELEAADEGDSEVQTTVCACVSSLAETLKPEYREILRRVELEGIAVKDYALEAGISSSNAAVRVFRAREALRKQVARSCGTCAEHGCVDCTCGTAHGQKS